MSDCWICSKCSWVNKATDGSCKACGGSAPPGTGASAPHPSAPPPYNPSVAQQPHVVTAQVVTGTPYTPSSTYVATPYAPTAPYMPSAPTAPTAPTAPSTYVPAATIVAPSVPAASNNNSDDHWICSRCSWVNRTTDGNCKACGRNAPPGIAPPVVVSVPGAVAATTSIPNGPPTLAPHQGSSYNDTAFSGFNKPNNHHVVTSNAYAPSVTSDAYTHSAASSEVSSVTPAPALAGAPVVPQKQQDNGFVAGFGNHVPGRSDAPSGGTTTTTSRPSTATTTTTTTYTSAPVHAPPAVLTSQSSVFQIKEKFWGFGDDFTITTQNKTPVYKVKGKIFSFGDQLSLQDLHGRELAFIGQKMFSFQPQYEIHRNGRLFARVVKEWTFFSQKFTLDVPGSNDYSIDGSFWEHDFTFRRQGRQVARVSKKYFSFTDSYGVEISPGEDAVSILCACIVIDQVLHDNN